MTSKPLIVCDDLLIGGSAIAKELHTTRHRVYRLAAQGRIPFFRMGNVVCARRSTLAEFMSSEEKKNLRG